MDLNDKGFEEIYKEIYNILFLRNLKHQRLLIQMKKPESFDILQKVSEDGYIFPDEFVAGRRDQEKQTKKLMGVLLEMIHANILRYGV